MAPSDAVPIARLRSVDDDDFAAEHRPPPAALQPNIGALLHDVARLMRRRFEHRAHGAGLPITRLQAGALLRIARNEGSNQAKIAAMMDIEPIALVRALDRLVEESLVERRPHPTDRRVWTLWLLPEGWRVVGRILEINQENREDALAGLSPSARDVLLGALNHMKTNLASEDEGAEAV